MHVAPAPGITPTTNPSKDPRAIGLSVSDQSRLGQSSAPAHPDKATPLYARPGGGGEQLADTEQPDSHGDEVDPGDHLGSNVALILCTQVHRR